MVNDNVSVLNLLVFIDWKIRHGSKTSRWYPFLFSSVFFGGTYRVILLLLTLIFATYFYSDLAVIKSHLLDNKVVDIHFFCHISFLSCRTFLESRHLFIYDVRRRVNCRISLFPLFSDKIFEVTCNRLSRGRKIITGL